MEGTKEKICPFCKSKILESESEKSCPACGIPHHESCWDENKGCTTFGCSEQHIEPKGSNISAVCANCGAPLGDGQVFCPKCGHKAGLAVDAGVSAAINQFNSTVEKKSKKSKAVPIAIVIIAVVALVIGFVTNSIAQSGKITAYKESADEFYSSLLSDAALLEEIGNAEVNNWHDYIYDDAFLSIELAVLMAQADNADAMTTVEANYDGITAAYKELLYLPKGADDELEEIQDAVKETYDAYVNFYETVINVSGNYESFSDAFHETDEELSRSIKKLGSLVS